MKMKIKLWMLAIGLSIGILSAHATDYIYLNVKSTDASTDYELANIQKITFTSDDMVLWMNSGQVELPLANIEKMLLSDMTTGIIQQQMTEREDFSFVDGKLTVEDGAIVTIYTLNGQVQKRFVAAGQTQIDLGDLPKGVYIVKVGKQAKKIINK